MIQDRPVDRHYGYVSTRDLGNFLDPSETPRQDRGRSAVRILGEFALAVAAYRGAESIVSGLGSHMHSNVLPHLAAQEGTLGRTVASLLPKIKDLSSRLDALEGITRQRGKTYRYFEKLSGPGKYKEMLQSKTIRWMRNLPTVLPALYITHRVVAAPPGRRLGDDLRSGRMKWYNPADWITDFAQTSARMMMYTAFSQIGLPIMGQYAKLFPQQHPYFSHMASGFGAQTADNLNSMVARLGGIHAGFTHAADQMGSPGSFQLDGGKFPGLGAAFSDFKRTFREGREGFLQKQSYSTLGPGTPIGTSRIADILSDMRKLGRPYGEDKLGSGIQSSVAGYHWKKRFIENLVKMGVPEETAVKLSREMSISTPLASIDTTNPKYAHLFKPKRISISGDKFATAEKLGEAAEAKMTEFGYEWPKDDIKSFSGIRHPVIDAAIEADKHMWNRRHAILGEGKRIADRQLNFQRAAGVAYAGKAKKVLSDPTDRDLLKKLYEFFGGDPKTDPGGMIKFIREGNWTPEHAKTFLKNRGVYAFGQEDLYNVLGLRKMTAKEFFMRGYAEQGDLYEELLKMPDADRILPGAKGMYMTASGEPVNFGSLWEMAASGPKSLFKFVSEQMKIPILRFNPLGILGGPTRAKARAQPFAQIHRAYTDQPMLGGILKEPVISYKTSRLGRGVVGLTHPETAPDMQFRGYNISSSSALGRRLQMLMGIDYWRPKVPRGGIRNFFHIAEAQPRSMWGKILRWADRSGGLENAGKSQFVQRLSEQGWIGKQAARGIKSVAGKMQTLNVASGEWLPNTIDRIKSPNASPDDFLAATKDLAAASKGGHVTQRAIDQTKVLSSLVRVTEPEQAKQVLKGIISGIKGTAKEFPEGKRQLFYRLGRHLQSLQDQGWNWATAPRRFFGKRTITNLDLVNQDVQSWFLLESVTSNAGIQGAWAQLQEAARQGLVSAKDLNRAQSLLIATNITIAGGTEAPTDAIRQMAEAWGGDLRSFAERAYGGGSGQLAGLKGKLFGTPKYEPGQARMTPLGAQEEIALIPRFSDVWRRSPGAAIKGALGFAGPKDLKTVSTGAIPMAHGVARLDRYREFFGMGFKWSDFSSPMDMFVRGWIGKTMLPLTLGIGGAMAINDFIQEKTGTSPAQDIARIGWIEPQMDIARVLSKTPVQPWLKRRAEIMGFSRLPFSRTPEELREHYEGEGGMVGIRKGRFWPLGNTPFRGGRIDYFMPNWYKRLGARTERNRMVYGSTAERLWYNWGPGKVTDPYHWEEKHYWDRPYPVTGEMFTGPWGPIQSALNITVGNALKPRKMMHSREIAQAMLRGPVGMPTPPGLTPSIAQTYNRGRINLTRPVTIGRMMGWDTRGSGTIPVPAVTTGGGGVSRLGKQQLSFFNQYYSAAGEMPVALTGATAITGTKGKSSGTTAVFGSGAGAAGYAAAGAVVAGTGSAGGGPGAGQGRIGMPYPTYPVLSPMRMAPMQERLTFPQQTGKPGLGYNLGEFGYQLQEMAGIYGFGFGAMRTALGGEQDFSPRRPMYQSAARMYGSERSFWDLNLGGLGDINIGVGDEYSNLEMSELIRRFIPHRRRQIMEYNPIPNRLGKQYPWLPSSNYFMNFHTGDPFIKMSRGEYRLPGPANAALYGTHPDAYGSPYGLEDKVRVLGDVAPWSDEYRTHLALARKSDLSSDARQRVAETSRQVAAKKRLFEFHPYRFANTDITRERVTVTGVVPGNPNLFTTREFPGHPMRLAGVRFQTGDKEAQKALARILKPGTSLEIQRDSSGRYPWLPNREQAIDVVAYRGGTNVNQWALSSGLGGPARTSGPADALVQYTAGERRFGAMWEKFAHMDTPLHTKFLPIRTAEEEYERRHLYGRQFQQWQKPIKSFLAPHVYKNISTRGMLTATLAGGALGYAFGANPSAGVTLGGIGAGAGFLAAGFGRAYRATHGGQRWIPKEKRRQMAIDEYTDILEYTKWSRLYHIYRLQAIQREGFDPQVWLEQKREQSSKVLTGERIAWSAAGIGNKPAKSPAQRSFEELGPMGTMAIMSYQRTKQTAYGVDLYGDWMNQYMAFTKRRRPFFNAFAEAPKRSRKRILSGLPRLERRIMEAKWGLPIEPKPDLIDYFSKHELPPPNWPGWLPEVNLDQVKLKVVKHQGLDYHDMGYYPQQMEEAELLNYSYPDFGLGSSTRSARSKLENLFTAAGVPTQVQERPSPQPGYHVRVGF